MDIDWHYNINVYTIAISPTVNLDINWNYTFIYVCMDINDDVLPQYAIVACANNTYVNKNKQY